MLIIFLRAFILFGILLVVIRLMGKRQLGEMEPFELVITLVISELACIPISDQGSTHYLRYCGDIDYVCDTSGGFTFFCVFRVCRKR